MSPFLAWLTTFTCLLGLAASLCLGLYVVTRTPRSRLSWLAALTLWSLSAFYLQTALLVARPDSGALPLLRPAIAVALALGFHLVLLLPPEREPSARDFYLPPLHLPAAITRRLGGLEPRIRHLGVPVAYGLALLLLLAGVLPAGRPPGAPDGPLLYLSDRLAGPLYPLSLAYLLLLEVLALLHVLTRRRAGQNPRQRRRHDPLLAAVILTGLGGLYLGLGVWLGLCLPGLPGEVAVGFAGLLLAYTVARHNALLEGRALNRDLLYISLVIGAFTLSYVAVAEVLYLGGHTFSTLTVILIIVVAVTSLMLYDGLRTTLDRLFYREQYRQLRANLRALAREAGMGQGLADRLQAVLAALCRTLGARRALVALRQEGGDFLCLASARGHPPGQIFAAELLAAAEIVELGGGGATRPEGMVLLVPLYAGEEQIGALLLGPKEAGTAYGERDLLLLDDLAEELVALVETMRRQDEDAEAISRMVAEFRQRELALQRQVQQMVTERQAEDRPVLDGVSERQFVSLVEDALRRIHDFSYLGGHALAALAVVAWRLEGRDEDFVTHIDRGKALSQVLVQALDKLRPDGPEPARHEVPPRKWYQFVILHAAYVEGELNRDVMSRLYISEGTFNRTRRRAIRGLARALREMEHEARQRLVARPS
jgi:hypothetical protein